MRVPKALEALLLLSTSLTHSFKKVSPDHRVLCLSWITEGTKAADNVTMTDTTK